MTDAEIDTLSDELISEFTNLGKDYPYLTKMIMDMVGIVSQQNAQLEAISKHLETITLEVNKQHFLIEDILRDEDTVVELPRFGSSMHLDYLSAFKKPDKGDLN